MVEFRTQPYTAMDRKYHERIEVDPVSSHANIEEPIIPIGELGQTIVEVDPTGRHKNMIQSAQAAIRAGAKKMQLMIQSQPGSAMGGLKSHGKEVREQMREVFKANEAILEGLEMPTAMSNLSGWNAQQGTFDDERLKRDMDEVKDAIRFAADVAEGGSVDIVSWEYARPLFNADWNKKGMFEESGEPVVQVVDERTGRIQMWRVNEIERVPVAKDPNTGKQYIFIPDIQRFAPIDEKKGYDPRKDIISKGKGKYAIIQDGKEIDCVDELQPWSWDKYEEWAKKENITPEEYFARQQADTQIKQARGWAITYKEHAKNTLKALNAAEGELQAAEARGESHDTIQLMNAKVFDLRNKYSQEIDSVESYEQQAAEHAKKAEYLKPIGQYAKARSVDSYAKLGIAARQETNFNTKVNKPLSVGPELGWPHAFGGHPQEFKELIERSRDRMVQLMTNKNMIDTKGEAVLDPKTGKPASNPFYEPGMSRREAEEAAKRHIKGCLDTSHMGMWLQHFKPDLPWDKRVKEFNNWYMEEVKKLADSDVVGSIQLVDSMSGAHGHLPPGQGIFPVVETAKEFKKKGFKGFMVSEGHEEEKFNEGRILVETWKAFNAPIGSSYGPGAPGVRDLRDRYHGRTYSPRMMFGGYTPPFGEYKPWAELPFE